MCGHLQFCFLEMAFLFHLSGSLPTIYQFTDHLPTILPARPGKMSTSSKGGSLSFVEAPFSSNSWCGLKNAWLGGYIYRYRYVFDITSKCASIKYVVPIYKLTVVDTHIYIYRERVILAIKFAYTP